MFNQFIQYIKQRHRIPLVSILCLLAIYASAQTLFYSGVDYSVTQVPQKPQTPQKKEPTKAAPKLIKLESAESVTKAQGFDYQVLIDSVVFYHDGAYLYCDSAHYDEKLNSFEAFSNVRMEQGDTIFLYGNYMYYDGNTKLVMVRENVRLENVPQNVTLFTDSLNYDRLQNLGYYFDGGMLVDSLNELTSYWGQYEPDLKMATFIDSVILLNPNFKLYSDTLKYNTGTKIATILSPSTILSDSGTIYTSRGWYNTVTDKSMLLNQSTVVNKEGNQYLRGDSIFYNKAEGYGEVFGNMFLQDTTKHFILRGHYGFYNERTNYAMATDSAFAIDYSQGDSLYIHADTLKLITVSEMKLRETPIDSTLAPSVKADSIQTDSVNTDLIKMDSIHTDMQPAFDSISPDSTALARRLPSLPPRVPDKSDSIKVDYREIKAYHGVRFYRSDMQGVCDSMQFNSKDSVLYLYRDPVLWNEQNQLSGDTIVVYMNDSTIDYIHVKRYSFSIEKKDSLNYNQLKGRSLKAFFEGKKLRRIFVEGNAESIFYPQEKDGAMIGLNWLEGSYLEIFMNDGKMEKLKVWPTPVGKMTPLEMVASDQRRLKDFYWYDYLRPLDKDDIFRKVSKKATDVRPKRSAVFDREE
ncbi:OstA-like protein [Dysgonomonas sp. ZJ709]|uniref:OstA-like protein n=1 Tax=Dysgonomonas sp. ZJ709 TaxID=2709797 RepID=UPI0021070CD6|nr:OstA-like protein [Dysgonomonas sp. ZJ709]